MNERMDTFELSRTLEARRGNDCYPFLQIDVITHSITYSFFHFVMQKIVSRH